MLHTCIMLLNESEEWRALLGGREPAATSKTAGVSVLRHYLRQCGPSFSHIDSFEQHVANMHRTLRGMVVRANIPNEKLGEDIGSIHVTILHTYITSPGGPGSQCPLTRANATNSSYSAILMADIRVDDVSVDGVTVLESQEYTRVILSSVPVMTMTRMCATRFAPRGTLVDTDMDPRTMPEMRIEGASKTMMSLDRPITGVCVTTHDSSKTGVVKTSCVCVPNSTTRVSFGITVLANPVRGTHSVRILLPYIKQHKWPMVTVFRALGCQTPRDIAHLMFFRWELEHPAIDAMLRHCFSEDTGGGVDGDEPMTTLEARTTIVNAAAAFFRNTGADQTTDQLFERIMNLDLLPQYGEDGNLLPTKAFELAGMCRRTMIVAAGIRAPDNRDHIRCKRIGRPCTAFEGEFSHMANVLRKELENTIITQANDRKRWDPSFQREDAKMGRMQFAIVGQGRITHQKMGSSAPQRVMNGVTQATDKLSFAAQLSQSTRVTNPAVAQDNHQPGPREHNSSTTGIFCMSGVTDGAGVGLTRDSAMGNRIAVACDPHHVWRVVNKILSMTLPEDAFQAVELGTPWPSRASLPRDAHIIYVNMMPRGVALKPKVVLDALTTLHRRCVLPCDVTFALRPESRELVIWSDADRACQIKAVVDRTAGGRVPVWELAPHFLAGATWTELWTLGIMDILCPDGMATALVRPSLNDCEEHPATYTHAEVTIYALMGVPVASNPFVWQNQSCRQAYGAGMGKQSIEQQPCTLHHNPHAFVNTMHYVQHPLTSTMPDRSLGGISHVQGGALACVAIITDPFRHGDTIEDPFMMSQGAADRGLFDATIFKTEECHAPKESSMFMNPSGCVHLKCPVSDYGHINPDGTPKVGARIRQGQVVIGRATTFSLKRNGAADNSANSLKRDSSVILRNIQEAVVEQVTVFEIPEKQVMCMRVLLKVPRPPIPGSKLATRHGMKGVISCTFPPEDAPFTDDGMVPDIIANPHSKISRMSWAEMTEGACNILGLELGGVMDSTLVEPGPASEGMFRQFMTDLQDGLGKIGWRDCERPLYHGGTGEPMGRCTIFFLQVQRLKQLVQEKLQVRNEGARQRITGQPTEGRRCEGGLRWGEMERSCAELAGAQRALHERFMELSDGTAVPVCRECGNQAIANNMGMRFCKWCGHGNVGVVAMPQATRVMMQEMAAMGIRMSFTTDTLGGGVTYG